jgi:hypothetical protein
VATKEVEHATITFLKELQTMEEVLKNEDAKSERLPCKKNTTRRIRLFYCQQHLVLGATSQG